MGLRVVTSGFEARILALSSGLLTSIPRGSFCHCLGDSPSGELGPSKVAEVSGGATAFCPSPGFVASELESSCGLGGWRGAPQT